MKTCLDCKVLKEDNEFNIKRYKSGAIGLRSYCKNCSHKQRQEWRATNPSDNERNKQYNKDHAEEIRGKKLMKYWPGLTWQECLSSWSNLFLEQKENCAICKKPNKRLHVDHCHSTGKVRGLLCYNCNNGLGRFKDNKTYLLDAASYLDQK